MYAEVWPLVDQVQGGHEFGTEEFEATIAAAFRQYPDGQVQRIAEAAVPPTPLQPPSLLRYFTEKNALQAATLAADVAFAGTAGQRHRRRHVRPTAAASGAPPSTS